MVVKPFRSGVKKVCKVVAHPDNGDDKVQTGAIYTADTQGADKVSDHQNIFACCMANDPGGELWLTKKW